MQKTLVLVALLGCTAREDGLIPVGSSEASPAELERYVRRLRLDLSGSAPAQADLDAALARLDAEGNTAATRGALADELLADRRFADNFVSELENRLFAGERLDGRYDLLCSIQRNFDPACQSCTGLEACDCECAAIEAIAADRALVDAAADDFATGATTSEIERRYGGSLVYRQFFATPEAGIVGMFDDFLGRPAEEDEIRNGAAMFRGALVDGAPAGLLFHRHGSTVVDLVDIVFSSEVYREAVVSGVFLRYLGRPASPAEQSHFAATLDASEPDARGLVRAVLSSGEYFDQ